MIRAIVASQTRGVVVGIGVPCGGIGEGSQTGRAASVTAARKTLSARERHRRAGAIVRRQPPTLEATCASTRLPDGGTGAAAGPAPPPPRRPPRRRPPRPPRTLPG